MRHERIGKEMGKGVSINPPLPRPSPGAYFVLNLTMGFITNFEAIYKESYWAFSGAAALSLQTGPNLRWLWHAIDHTSVQC